MAEQKARSFLFKIPAETGLREIKTAIEEITGENAITVFQQSGISEYLVASYLTADASTRALSNTALTLMTITSIVTRLTDII